MMMERLLKLDNESELITAGRNNAAATRLANELVDAEVRETPPETSCNSGFSGSLVKLWLPYLRNPEGSLRRQLHGKP